MGSTMRFGLTACMALLMVCSAGMASTTTADWSGLQAAITAAAAGDTVQLAAGTYDVSATTINVAKAVVVDGSGSTLNLTGGGNVFRLSNGAILQGFSFNKVDTANQEIVYVGTPNVSVLNNTFQGTYHFPGSTETTRAMVVQSGASNVTISGNTISNLRQPAYVNWGTGTISNNSVSGTKGWVIDTSGSQAPYTITGNTFSGNVTDDSGLTDFGPVYGFTDICLIGNNSFYDPVAVSAANNHAVVVDKTNGGVALRVLNRTQNLWYTTLAAAVAAANAGDDIECSGGPYSESVTVNKALTITGAGDEVTGTVLSVASGATSFNITASDVTLEDLRIRGTSWSGTGVVVTGDVDNIALNNVTITGTFIGVSLPVAADVAGLTVSDCDLVNNNGALTVAGKLDGLDMSGCHLDDNSTGLRAHDPTSAFSPNLIFTNVNISNSSFSRNQIKGIYVEKLNNANLSNITIDGSGNNLGYPKSGCAGIDINCKDGSFSNITISNLNVNNSGIAGGAGGGAVVIKGRNDGTYAAKPGQLSNVTISGATITNCGMGLSFGNNLSGITVSGANITPTASGVGLAFWSLPSGAAISSLNATVNGPAALGVALSDIPTGDIDLGNVSLAGSLTEFIRVQLVPESIVVDAQRVSFGDAATDADKEAK
ncbi:MAG: right-handed parallel beta-helix repeat-containing protein, partial [Bacteroidota bacterium]